MQNPDQGELRMADDITPSSITTSSPNPSANGSREASALGGRVYEPYAGYVHPYGYHIARERITTIPRQGSAAQPKEVAFGPVCISGISEDEQGNEWWELCWLDDRDQWRSTTVPRELATNSRKVHLLSGQTLPVDSTVAVELVKYLSVVRVVNRATLLARKQVVANHLGWLDDRTFVCADGHPLMVRSRMENAEPFIRPFGPQGTAAAWRQAINQIAGHMRPLTAIYASLAAPLLRVLGAPSFTVDFSGSTSIGKTTVLRIAASCWGDPSDRGLVNSWRSKPVGIERIAAIRKGLPMFLDETKSAVDRDDVVRVLYQISQDQTAVRGSVTGFQPNHKWQTVLLSTGEQPITSFDRSGGSIARCITLWGPPFPEGSEALVNEVAETVGANYGHTGPAFVERLLALDREKLRARWRQHEQALRAGKNAVAGRRSAAVAILWLAGTMAAKWGLVPGAPDERYWHDVAVGGGALNEHDDDRARQALEFTLNWAVTNRSKFWSGSEMSHEPVRGWAGVWRDDRPWLAIAGDGLIKSLLEEHGHDYESVVRQWRDRGWVQADPRNGRLTQVIKLGGKSARLVKVMLDHPDVSAMGCCPPATEREIL